MDVRLTEFEAPQDLALQLIVDLLASQGVFSMGLGADVENARACRAFRRAGFQQTAAFQEAQRSLVYFTRAARLAPPNPGGAL